MLQKRNLDDQSYRAIVDAAMGRLPWICPQWTDHNSHDPGVTVLELMAWYKEMQQFQMNQLTDPMKQKLLKLTGVICRPASAAQCAVSLPHTDVDRPALSRLRTPEGIPFELLRGVPANSPVLKKVLADGQDLTALLETSALTFRPFAFRRKEHTALRLGFSNLSEGNLRIWFEVEEPDGVARNPFDRLSHQPRLVQWLADGLGPLTPDTDETHGLCQSGYVEFSPRLWPVDADGCSWLELWELDPGCEEPVRLSQISVCRRELRQQESLAVSHPFRVSPQPRTELVLQDALARRSVTAVFLRRVDGWIQQTDCVCTGAADGLHVSVNTEGCAVDSDDNLVVVCLDQDHARELLLEVKGLPGETLRLDLDGRTALTEKFTLWCSTLYPDGQVRFAPWKYTADLSACGPRDRVFAFDPIRETVCFGDGCHGAPVCAGAVLTADLVLSVCGGGNIPAHAGLRFETDGLAVDNTAAAGGAPAEHPDQAAARLLRQLKTTVKCAGAADYEYLAKTTPGLRVGAVKALPGYDPEAPTVTAASPVVTVVAAPASGTRQPDLRFLQEIRARLEHHRPVCTCIRVVAPEYKEVDAVLRLQVRDGVTEEQLRRVAEEYLSADGVGIGGLVSPGELMARLQAVPGVVRVRSAELRTAAAGCYQNASGEIRLPRCGIACLRQLRLERTPAEN